MRQRPGWAYALAELAAELELGADALGRPGECAARDRQELGREMALGAGRTAAGRPTGPRTWALVLVACGGLVALVAGARGRGPGGPKLPAARLVAVEVPPGAEVEGDAPRPREDGDAGPPAAPGRATLAEGQGVRAGRASPGALELTGTSRAGARIKNDERRFRWTYDGRGR